MGKYLINHNEHIKKIVLYCNVDTVSSDCFSGAQALESVVLPETVTVIGGAAFKDCISLRELYLPESLTSIEAEAFYGCGLTEINLPNTLKNIGLRAFARSSLKNIVIPESVTNIDHQVFQYCDSLISADMSAAQTTVLHFGLFEECPNLRELKLPECLESFDQYDIWAGHPATSYLPISKLVLPDGFKSFGGVRFKQLTEIVWPTSLIDGSSLLECPLRKIYYKGNEAQWNMVMGHENFSNVTIVFN